MNRDMKKATSWLERNFCFSAQREADQYFKQYHDGQDLEPFQRVVSNTVRHLHKGRTFFAALATVAALSAIYCTAVEEEVPLVTSGIAFAFGALALRDHRRCIFWQMVGQQATNHGIDFSQQVLRSAQRGDAGRARTLSH